MKKKIKTIVLALVVSLFALLIIVFSADSKAGVRVGLNLCSNILIPSLFPFMVLSCFIVKSGLAKKIGKKLNFLTRKLFSLPGACACVILTSQIGGYPVGARGINALYKDGYINSEDAVKMSYFCVGAGPPFTISIIGVTIFHSFTVGIILFLSQVLSSITIGILVSRLKTKSKVDMCKKSTPEKNKGKISITNSLVESVIDSISAMINMCGFVLIFSCLIFIFNATFVSTYISAFLLDLGVPYPISVSLLPSLLEITNGSFISASVKASPLFFSFILAFAGVSIHFQIFSSCRDIPIKKLRFLFFRILHGLFSVLFTYLGIKLFYKDLIPTILRASSYSFEFSHNFFSGLALIFLCLIFLLSVCTVLDKNSNSNKKN